MQNPVTFQFRSLLLMSIVLFLVAGCLHTAPKVGLYPASEQTVDVFTCRGLDEQGHWTGITDRFLPDVDPYVIVAAQLQPKHRQSRVVYELTSPADFVVLSESFQYPKETDLGVHFDMNRLMQVGGEGKWTAAVYADGLPLGKANFTIGEKKEEMAEVSRYAVVGEEEAASEPVEATPSLSETSKPAVGEAIESATPSLSPVQQRRQNKTNPQPSISQ